MLAATIELAAILRDAAKTPRLRMRTEIVSRRHGIRYFSPHGEERGKAARLEP
jgi:hypothetical protein